VAGVQSFEFDREGTIREMQEARQISRGLQTEVAICECARGGATKKSNLRADDMPGQGVLHAKAGKTGQIQHEAGLQLPHDALANLHDSRATRANQMMPMSRSTLLQQRVPRGAVPKMETFHQAQPLQHLDGPINRRKIAVSGG
jgi:hypothetical protein